MKTSHFTKDLKDLLLFSFIYSAHQSFTGFAVLAFCGSFQSLGTGSTKSCELEKVLVVLDILKAYRSVPAHGTGHIPRQETKSSHNTGVARKIFSLLFLYLFLLCDCNGYGISHLPQTESSGQLCCNILNPPGTTVPISCAFSTRVELPSSDSFRFCLQSWRNL